MPRPSEGLWVFLHGTLAGLAVRARRAVYFMYAASYPLTAVPLSLSLPVGARTRDIAPWIDGLLPDNQRTRLRWAQAHGALSVEPFDLLSTSAGLECAGAVQFSAQEELPGPSGDLVVLSDVEVARRLRDVARDAEGAPLGGLEELRLSLAGAQPKMALRLTDDGWRLPTGTLATTHILKPQSGHLNPQLRPSMAVNEHLCQSAATRLGLDAAATSLELFDDEACLVTERFDRRVDRGEVWRCHFEDLCQASGFAPVSRYQESGGPTPERLMKLLSRETGRAGARMFFMSMFYNWLVGNTDGHSKNYGVLLDGPAPRLAPLYDLSSVAPYLPPDDWLRPSAMRFAESHPASVSQWAHTAARLNVGVAGDELSAFAEALPDAFSWAVSRCPAWASDTAEQVGESIVAHARTASSAGGSAGSPASFEPLRSVAAVDDSGTCGATVERTDKPCLLRSGHAGRCRSVL